MGNTKSARIARAKLFRDLSATQQVMSEMWAEQSIPLEWHGLDDLHPEMAKKQKVTLYLDQDVLRWYRALGRGYHGRINQILRIYKNGVLSGDIYSGKEELEVHPDQLESIGPNEAAFERKLKEMAQSGALDKQQLSEAAVPEIDFDAARREILEKLAAYDEEGWDQTE